MSSFVRLTNRLCLLLLALAAWPLSAAETLSPGGSLLSNINLSPDNSQQQVSKIIDLGNHSVVDTYLLVRLKNGPLYQKTPSGFSLFDPQTGLVSLGLTATHTQLNYEVISGGFFDLFDYPLTVYLGYTDRAGTLYFGAFYLTADLQALTSWSETAVRKVLHNFAYGGFADDTQIQTWANMTPASAITEMLTAATVNTKLSPPPVNNNLPTETTLKGLSAFWASNEATNLLPIARRDGYDLRDRKGAERTWRQAVNLRGLNPVRQFLGFWETNYHLSVNLDAEVGINNQQMARYYDDIMNALASDQAYQTVVGEAALSSAVATQFNHRRNTYDNQNLTFRGNEDFAREYHQIFFGILGAYNPSYHEEVAIKNTALALTDMPVELVDGRLAEEVSFGTAQHHSAPLDILAVSISGATAAEKIRMLSQYAIEHPESLDNLPIIIARGLADDNLTPFKIKQLQSTWTTQSTKNLLDFLRSYAISTAFHDASRVKYLSAVDRYLAVLNQLTLSNEESLLDLYQLNGYESAGVEVFRPMHDVFGAQTGAEAADSAAVFTAVYRRSTEQAHINSRSFLEEGGQTIWVKDWEAVMPATQGAYPVQQAADWLWNRFMADGLKNLGALERFHLYALLATGTDAGYALDHTQPDRVFSSAEISGDAALQTALENWGRSTLALGGPDSEARRTANQRVGQAINFMAAIPYTFAQEGQ